MAKDAEPLTSDPISRAYSDETDCFDEQLAEDEKRWQRYLETGQTVSLDAMRKKLRGLST